MSRRTAAAFLVTTAAVLLSIDDSAAAQPSSFEARIRAKLQPHVDAIARSTNSSYSVGVATNQGDVFHHFAVVAGLDDHATGTSIDGSSRFPMGSVTKLFTTVLVLRLAERGLVDLDAPVAPIIDPFLRRTNGTTLATIWASGGRNATTWINQITARQLMAMRSGLPDYPDDELENYANDPAFFPRDISPYDFLHRWAPKHFAFPPGHGGAYSSIGYVLLGFVAAAANNHTHWSQLDQREVVPLSLRAELPGLMFEGNGACVDKPDMRGRKNIVHQYRELSETRRSGRQNVTATTFEDIAVGSCLNGWTMGNIAATPSSVAAILYQIFSKNRLVDPEPILSDAFVLAMQNFSELTTEWNVGMPYGLGLTFKHQWLPGLTAGNLSSVITGLGHPGVDWGSNANFNYFFGSPVDVAINVGSNSNSGMNCSSLGTNKMSALYVGDRLGQCALCIVAEERGAIGAADAALCKSKTCPAMMAAAEQETSDVNPRCCWDAKTARCKHRQ